MFFFYGKKTLPFVKFKYLFEKRKTMTKNSVKIEHHQTFESLREKENGCEFWNALKLAKVLEYPEYRHFLPVVEKAKKACKNSGQDIMDHFEDILEMIQIGKGGQRQVTNIKNRIGLWI